MKNSSLIKSHLPILPFTMLCLFTATVIAEDLAQPTGLDGLIAESAKVQVHSTDHKFLEGPVAAPNGDLYFADIRLNLIHRWDVNARKATIFLSDSQGANGGQSDAKGRLISCQGGMRRVVAIDQQGKVVQVIADTFEGKKLNRPNDLWIDPKGGIYFTDPNYSMKKADMEQDGCYAYYVSPDGKKITRVAKGNKPNGIVGTPDGKTLFLTDRRHGGTRRFDINDDGTLSNGTRFCKVNADGITLDEKGNLYTTPQGKHVVVFDQEGKEIGRIPLPGMPTNVCFAGKDGKTLFITTHNVLCSLQMKVSGE